MTRGIIDRRKRIASIQPLFYRDRKRTSSSSSLAWSMA